jgi:general secretion pathway protein F
MPRFRYKAFDELGALVEGDIEATGAEAARAALFDRKLFPFATSAAGATAELWWQRDITFGSGLSRDELALFTREFATLLSAELPLDLVLSTLAGQVSSRRQRKLADALREKVVGGSSLSDAFAAQGGAFPNYFISIVRAGEAGGSLRAAMDQLAQFQERSLEVLSRVRSALVYPAILLLMAVGAVGLILTVLVPTLRPLFKDQGVAPPLFLQVLINLQSFVSTQWVACLIALAVMVLGAVFAIRSEGIRAWLDAMLLRLPIAGDLAAKSQTARLARTLSTLLKNGVPMLAALTIGQTVVSNRVFAAALRGMIDEVNQGEPLKQAMANADVFPSVAVRLVSVGEDSGRLDELLLRVAEMFEAQVQRKIDRLMSLLTPLLTLGIGLLVGALMMSVMNAILSINDLATK